MDSLYPTSQPYNLYAHNQWIEESKPAFVREEHESSLGNETLDPVHPVNSSSLSAGRRPSILKIEDDFSASVTPTASSSAQMWQDRPHGSQPARSFSTPHASMMNGNVQPFHRMNDGAFGTHIQHANTWSVSQSGASTPTPLYVPVYDMPYTHPASAFPAYPHDPNSAVSMSPQSSQGGWASTTSSDGTEQRGLISPPYRPTSPGTVMRPDGIRKKNARFEIPKERNLANIDAMILVSTDENEKKELKQQKRLLRNRQAALDSRQRKKTHTEKLEAEKKVSEKRMLDIEETVTRMENTLAIEREQFMQQRQHLENVIHALQFERDEVIRAKTIETADLRRRNLVLEECIKEMDGQQQRGYAPAEYMNGHNGGFNSFDFDVNPEDEGFRFINSDDWKMDDAEQRQATPKPIPVTSKAADAKADAGFSWSTFYMCLLFGAFIASNSNNSTSIDNNAASAIASSISSAEASNVLKTVLSSGAANSELLPTQTDPISNAVLNGINGPHAARAGTNADSSSSLDHLHQSLSTPSRRQEMTAAFSMSASSYQHLTDPFNEHINVDGDVEGVEPPPPPPPSALQKAFASMQAQKDDIDKLTGMGSKARERSLLWDQVPSEVIKNFEAMIHKSTNTKGRSNVERMEQ